MNPASGGGGHLTTTFGHPSAVGFVVVGGRYPTTAAGGLLSAMGCTGRESAKDVINGHTTPTTNGFATATSLGDGHLVTNTGTTSPAPSFAGALQR